METRTSVFRLYKYHKQSVHGPKFGGLLLRRSSVPPPHPNDYRGIRGRSVTAASSQWDNARASVGRPRGQISFHFNYNISPWNKAVSGAVGRIHLALFTFSLISSRTQTQITRITSVGGPRRQETRFTLAAAQPTLFRLKRNNLKKLAAEGHVIIKNKIINAITYAPTA